METLKPKAAVHGQPQKAFSKNASDENERWRWEQEMYARKNADLDKNNHYDYSRKGQNFEIVKGEIKPLGLQEKRLHERLQDKLEELGFKGYKDGAQNMPNACVDWVFSGDHDRMCEMAFGASYKDIDYTAEKDNTEAIKNTDAYRFTAGGYKIGTMPNIYQWALDSYRFACEKWGEDNIIGAEVHLDETTPHMHLLMVPVAERKTRGRASTKYQKKSDSSIIIKKKEYEALSDEEKANYAPVAKASKKLVSYSGVFGDNYGERKQYMKDFHTEYHDKVGQKYGLERGDDLDLLDPEERRKRRHMRKDQLHAVQEHDKKLAEQAERNKALEEKRDELDRAIKDKQDKATNIDKAIEESKATLANVKEELAAAKEDVTVYSYEADQALQRRDGLLSEISKLNKNLDLRKQRDKEIPTLKEIIERENRDKKVPSLADIIARENRDKAVPSLEQIIERENRDRKAPSWNDIIARENCNKAVPSLKDIIARENRNKAVPSLEQIIEREKRNADVPSLKEIEAREEKAKDGRKKYYQSFVLPKVEEKLDVSVEPSRTGRMAVFAAVNGTWLSGVYLTEQQVEDYNSGLATADQLAAQLLSATILKKVNEEKAAKISREVDNLQKQKQQLVADVTALEKKQNEIIGVYNSNKEIYDKIHKEYADYQKLVKTMIMAYDYRVHPLPGVFQALIESEGIPERSEYDERSYFTGHRWNNGNPYIQIHTIPDHTTYISISQEDYQRIENNQTTMWEFVNRKYAPVAVKNSTDLEQQFGISRGNGIGR